MGSNNDELDAIKDPEVRLNYVRSRYAVYNFRYFKGCHDKPKSLEPLMERWQRTKHEFTKEGLIFLICYSPFQEVVVEAWQQIKDSSTTRELSQVIHVCTNKKVLAEAWQLVKKYCSERELELIVQCNPNKEIVLEAWQLVKENPYALLWDIAYYCKVKEVAMEARELYFAQLPKEVNRSKVLSERKSTRRLSFSNYLPNKKDKKEEDVS